MDQILKTAVLVTALTGFYAPVAFAQSSPPPAQTAPPAVPPAPGPLDGAIKSDSGVIKPKTDVDPGLDVKPPTTDSKMPVIPPSSSPSKQAK